MSFLRLRNGIRSVFDATGKALPLCSRIQFMGPVEDDDVNKRTIVHAAPEPIYYRGSAAIRFENLNRQERSDGRTVGSRFTLGVPLKCAGAQYGSNFTIQRTIELRIYENAAASPMTTKQFVIPTGIQVTKLMFDAPVQCARWRDYQLAVREVGGNTHCYVDNSSYAQYAPLGPFSLSPGVMMVTMQMFNTGDGNPTTTGTVDVIPLDPIFA